MPLPTNWPVNREYGYGTYGSDLYGGLIIDLNKPRPPGTGAAAGEEAPPVGTSEQEVDAE